MDRLWAPWRIKYIRNKARRGCIFCLKKNAGPSSFVVFRTRKSVCMLNSFPYNNGHVMVAPKRHVADFGRLTDDEALDLFAAIKKIRQMLDKVMKPQGYNIGANISSVAGAGIEGHLHIHIVPRWRGDTNFMPVVHNTKVISQSLKELLKQLKNAEPEFH